MTFSFPSSYLFTSNAVIDGCLLENLRNRRCLYFKSLNRRFGNAAFFRVQVSLRSCALPIIPFMSLFLSRRPLFKKKRLTAGQVQVLLQD